MLIVRPLLGAQWKTCHRFLRAATNLTLIRSYRPLDWNWHSFAARACLWTLGLQFFTSNDQRTNLLMKMSCHGQRIFLENFSTLSGIALSTEVFAMLSNLAAQCRAIWISFDVLEFSCYLTLLSRGHNAATSPPK